MFTFCFECFFCYFLSEAMVYLMCLKSIYVTDHFLLDFASFCDFSGLGFFPSHDRSLQASYFLLLIFDAKQAKSRWATICQGTLTVMPKVKAFEIQSFPLHSRPFYFFRESWECKLQSTLG